MTIEVTTGVRRHRDEVALHALPPFRGPVVSALAL
jgi:hypothetical protein